MRLRTRIILATMTLVTLVVGVPGAVSIHVFRTTMMQQIGENALDVARAVARMPELREAMAGPDPAAVIQPLAEQIRQSTGAAFIVVGNEQGIRYSHPVPERIGQHMVGGDNAPALEQGQEYVSIATGTLGRSMRGKVPVLGENGEIIGIVSVGFLLTDIDRAIRRQVGQILIALLFGFGIGIPGAILLARDIKQAIHGMEPAEIAALAQQRNAILGAIREGIIAIDAAGRVDVANATARAMVPGLEPGVRLVDVLPNSRLPRVLETGEPEFDQEMLLGDHQVITNRVPVRIGGRVTGGVATFRDRSELERLYRELTDIRRYSDDLRAQAHEFANALQAISGMLQLGQVDDAVDFIHGLSEEQRQLVEALPRTVSEPAVAALLLGKRARADELRCRFTLDPRSRLAEGLADPALLVKVVGNLVDNALDAVQAVPPGQRSVRVWLAGRADGVYLEVADSGPGIPPEQVDQVFVEGFSTKAAGRGIGLALVRRLLDRVGGRVQVGQAPEGGALFRVTIPRAMEV